MKVNSETEKDQQILLLAIAIERHSARMYQDWAHRFRAYDGGMSAILEALGKEELGHERELMDLYVQLTGKDVPEPLPEPMELQGVVRGLQSIQDHFFVVDPGMAETILESALRIERFTYEFYIQFQSKVEDRQVAALIRRLVEFEGEHVRIFLERV